MRCSWHEEKENDVKKAKQNFPIEKDQLNKNKIVQNEHSHLPDVTHHVVCVISSW